MRKILHELPLESVYVHPKKDRVFRGNEGVTR